MNTPTSTLAYHLRPAVETDFLAIRDLIHRVQINPLDLHWPNFIIAVDETGGMIGCGQIKIHRDGSHELASIAVVSEWRRRGVAGAIIRRLLVDQISPLFLTCRTPLGQFYQLFGFRVAQPNELPPYFNRIRRLTGAFRFLRLMPPEGLLIMVRVEGMVN